MSQPASAPRIPNLRFPEFSGEWCFGSISNLVESLDAGVSVNSVDEQGVENDKAILKTSCVTNGFFDYKEHKKVVDETEISRLKESVKAETIIISRMNTPNLVGANAYVEKDFPNLFLPDRLWAAKISKKASPRWVSFLTSSPKTRAVMSSRATGTSDSMKNITKSDVMELPVFFPSLPEQTKIAAFLSSVDTKIDQLSQKKALLEQYKKGVMQQIFSQQIRFKADDGRDYPEWEEKRLEDFLSLALREIPTPREHYLSIGVRSHGKGTFQKPDSDPNKISMDKLYEVKENDLIVSITFAWEGAIAIVKKDDEGGLVSHRFPTYVFDTTMATHEFFKYIITQKNFRLMLDLISPGGAGRNRVMSKKDFIRLSLLMPSLAEQTKIANFLSAIDSKIEQVAQQLDAAKQFKKGLLQQMFV